jgi:glycosyltransferase involved in cell wall biosynthesis
VHLTVPLPSVVTSEGSLVLVPSGFPSGDSSNAPLAGTRVLVVALNYAPEPTGSAPYTAGLAEMLVAQGASVEAIVGVPHYPAWRVEPDYRYKLRSTETLNGVALRRTRHFVPGRQSALTRLMWEGTFALNAGTTRPSVRPDVVIASTPSLSGAAVGARLAARYDVPFGVVVQDLVGQAASQSGVRGGSAVAGAASRVEGNALRSAAGVAVVSDAFRAQVAEYGVPEDRVSLFRNWTHTPPANRDRADVRRSLGWSDDDVVVLHTGNMGLKQDLGNVVEAARRLPAASRVRLVLMGDGNQRAALQEAAAGVRALEFAAPVEGDLYPDVLRAADVLLVNERSTVGDMSLPSKLTSYFAAGRPVLAAVSDGGACAAELAAAAGAAVRVDPADPDALVAAVGELAEASPDRLDAMGQAGAAYARETLGPEAASRRAVAFVDSLLGTPRSTEEASTWS